MSERVNIASYLPDRAARAPHRRAIVFPEGRDRRGRVAYTHLTFAQLDAEADALAHGFVAAGLARGTRVAMLVRPSLEFVAVTYALFKLGAVPILVDPGMGRKALLSCFAEARPEGFIGVARAHLARLLFPSYFRSVRVAIRIGGPPLGGIALDDVRLPGRGAFPVAQTRGEEVAAILFTSGSTGIAKGVPFTHGMIQSQVTMQQAAYGIGDDEIDLPAFPLFALFSTAFGATAVIPDMDPTRPAQVDPARIVEAIRNQGVTHTFGSPAIWRRVGQYCTDHSITLPSIRRVLMAGAPVPPAVLRQWSRILPTGRVHTPYGATECLGVSSIAGDDVCAETAAKSAEGAGTCVGRPFPETEVRILRITAEPLSLSAPGWSGLGVAAGEVGEITVQSPLVAREYLGRPEETARSKIVDGDRVWHRMGDLGYFDAQGRLWFCGRKAHRVVRAGDPLYSVMVEGHFNGLEGVRRSALVGVPDARLGQASVLVVEPESPAPASRDALRTRLLERASDRRLPIDHVMFHDSFPVDVRHNAKIRREDLAVWAAHQLKIALPSPTP